MMPSYNLYISIYTQDFSLLLLVTKVRYLKSPQSIYGLRQEKKRRCEISFLCQVITKKNHVIFIMRYVSALGLVLNARVFGSW